VDLGVEEGLGEEIGETLDMGDSDPAPEDRFECAFGDEDAFTAGEDDEDDDARFLPTVKTTLRCWGSRSLNFSLVGCSGLEVVWV
jgi:hypothetical protein